MGASGRSGQFGFGAESTPGTAVTVDHFAEINSEGIEFTPTELQGMGLRASGLYPRDSRRVRSRKSAAGPVNMDFATNKMGLLLKNMLGAVSGPTQQASTAAYKAVFTPADTKGLGLTMQVGRPQTDGTVQAFTYKGCKIPSWEISVSDNDIAKLNLDVDAWDQDTATGLASASYVAGAGVFNFAQVATFKIGGTASTTSGVVSISGGTTVSTIAKGFSLKGTTPMDTERFGLGNAGVKAEQRENDWRSLSGSLDAEFTSRSEFYDLFAADTTTALQLTFTGANIESTYYRTLDIILPAVRFSKVNPLLDGPGLVRQTLDFDVTDDGANAVVQITTISTDTAL